MSNIVTKNDMVAVEVIEFDKGDGQAKKTVRGLDLTDRLVMSLVSSKVVFNSKTYTAGTQVYFKSDIRHMPQLKQKMSLNGKEFILLPESTIVAAEEPSYIKSYLGIDGPTTVPSLTPEQVKVITDALHIGSGSDSMFTLGGPAGTAVVGTLTKRNENQ